MSISSDKNGYQQPDTLNDDFSINAAGYGDRREKRVTFNTSSSLNYMTSEAYKSLRTNILFCGEKIKTILITSCNENEGKSTISTELSKSLAEINKKTLFIDADLRKSVLLRKSQRSREVAGLSELLSGQASFSDVLYHTQNPNYDVIFSGHFPPDPVELLGSEKFASLIEKLQPQYDYIIIDSPPLGAVIDAAVISALCDGAIMVINSGKINYRLAQEIAEQIQKSGCKLLGAVLNETDSKLSKYNQRYYKNSKYRYSYYSYGHESDKE